VSECEVDKKSQLNKNSNFSLLSSLSLPTNYVVHVEEEAEEEATITLHVRILMDGKILGQKAVHIIQ
jgi:hypothetical protein